MARPLPGRRGGLDPAQRADARARVGDDPGRAQGALGRAGREPLQPPDRRLRQRDPPRSAAARVRTSATARCPASTRCSRPTSAASASRCWPTSGPSRPAGLINEVWNHGIYKYIATYHAIPGRGPRAVRIVLELHANSGSMLNGQDDKDRGRQLRVQPGLRARRPGRRDQPLRGRLDRGRRRSAVRAPERPGAGGIAMAGPQPARDRGERPVAGPGQRRRQAALARFRSTPPTFRPGLRVRGRPPGDDRQRHTGASRCPASAAAAASSAASSGGEPDSRPSCQSASCQSATTRAHALLPAGSSGPGLLDPTVATWPLAGSPQPSGNCEPHWRTIGNVRLKRIVTAP